MMLSPATQPVLEIAHSIAPLPAPTPGPRNLAGQIIPVFEEEHCTESSLLDTLQHRFTFNGETHALSEEVDWLRNPSQDIEWHILLHKFYYAPGLARHYSLTGDSRDRDCFERLVRSWIAQTPNGYIATDVTARRVQNWIYAWWLFCKLDPDCFSREFTDELTASLVDQVDYICENLATKRNHRTLALYAVFLASVVLPDSARASDWRNLAVTELLNNIEDDLLADGVHCELSTDYHHIVLRSYLLFIRVAAMNGIPLPDCVQRKVCLALDFAAYVHRPDGDIPALSDSDSQSFLQLLDWGAELFGRDDYAFVASRGATGMPPESQHKIFADGGYAILRSPWERGDSFTDARYLVFDCGRVGEGNHGHLDALNIEVAAFGQPLVLDPGRYTYDEQGEYNWRAHFRQTAAHNTVTVNGENQAIYKQRGAKLRVFNPQPACSLVDSALSDEMAYLHGVVSSPNYAALHHRHIWFVDNAYWVILDRLLAEDIHDYALRFQLSPNASQKLTWMKHDAGTEIIGPGLTLFIAQQEPDVSEEAGYVSANYGSKQLAPRICAQATAADYCFLSVLYPTRHSLPLIEGHNDGTSHAVLIDRGNCFDTWHWCANSQQMSRRTSEGVQSWCMPKGNHHG